MHSPHQRSPRAEATPWWPLRQRQAAWRAPKGGRTHGHPPAGRARRTTRRTRRRGAEGGGGGPHSGSAGARRATIT
eukprot:13645768-Alexandrium_andersonii.AAC.1